MTDTRTKGRGTRAELDIHLSELGKEAMADDTSYGDFELTDLDAAKREVAWLRKEVFDLRERLQLIRQQTADVPKAPEIFHPWIRIAATVATTFVLGKLVERLSLGAHGVAVLPMIAARRDRRLR